MKKIHKLIFSSIVLISGLTFCSCTSNNEPAIELNQNRSIKRGVSYNFSIVDDAALLAPGVSWFYNWGTTVNDAVNTATQENKIDYFPMTWNGNFNAAQIRAYKQTHPECEYILAYNEPNLTDQANMTPQQAAAQWPALKSLADELNMKIISPAMNYGTLAGYGDPIVWLDEFFSLIPISDIDGIAVHCYMANASALAWYIERFKKYDKPVWLTEFCAWETGIKNVSDQMRYMSDAVNYLECNNNVARYAWFIPRGSGSVASYPFMQLLTKTKPYELSDLGKVFVNMSTQDKTIYYPEKQMIPAENYSSLNMIESVNEGKFEYSVHLRPTTDSDGVLEVFDFISPYWLEYQVNITNKYDQVLDFRYAAENNAAVEIYVDDEITATCNFSSTGADNVWNTTSTPVNFSLGKHTVKLRISTGSVVLNWIRISKK